MTVEMGCHVPGVITLDWSEYGSADLEIRYGSQLELASKLKSMVRRSSDRLGYQLDIQSAQAILGTPAERRLLMSNSEFSRLPAAERLVNRPRAVDQQAVQAQPAPGFYARQADAAASAMSTEFTRRQNLGSSSNLPGTPRDNGGVPLSWADETERFSASKASDGQSGLAASPPHYQNEVGLLPNQTPREATPHRKVPEGRAPPVPSGPPIRQAPAPSTVSNGGRTAPPPSAVG